jgi:hypothetical protein
MTKVCTRHDAKASAEDIPAEDIPQTLNADVSTSTVRKQRVVSWLRPSRQVRKPSQDSVNLSLCRVLPPLGGNDLSRNSFGSRAKLLV